MKPRYKPKMYKFETGAEYTIKMLLEIPKPFYFWGASHSLTQEVSPGFHREDGPASVKGNIAEFFVGGVSLVSLADMSYLFEERKTAVYFQSEKKRKGRR